MSPLRHLAATAVELLAERTTASGSDWALGVEARCRALVSEGDAAERSHRQAIWHLNRSRVRVELARAHSSAHDMLAAMGAEGYAERARRELIATGETARRRTADTASMLTAREAQVARMARDGLSNPEIGTRLFLSPRTVEYHLRHVFVKLGITSRAQLYRRLDDSRAPASP